MTGEASLQRVVIASSPGGPADIAGRPASEVCSRDALARLILDTPGLPAPQPELLADQLGELRSSAEGAVRDLPGGVLRAYGVRLGALLATLMDPDTPAEQGRIPVRRAYLEHWLGIDRVWLGGGLLVGDAAGDILAGAQQLLSCAGILLDVRVGPSPAVLPLLGRRALSSGTMGEPWWPTPATAASKPRWPWWWAGRLPRSNCCRLRRYRCPAAGTQWRRRW